jgi:dsDNA-specific endonuclease/ATPase MutS2
MDIHAFANSLTPLEVDLHIQKLTDDFVGLSNSEMMVMQLSHFESYMDLGMRGQYRSIIFIHGIGNGVLKKEIKRRLSHYSSIRFSDGDPRKYGFGATQVDFDQ